MDKRETLAKVVSELGKNIENEPLLAAQNKKPLPETAVVNSLVKQFRLLLFPGVYQRDFCDRSMPETFLGEVLEDALGKLTEQIALALDYVNTDPDAKNFCDIREEAQQLALAFAEKLPEIQLTLLDDVEAGFNGDPAAKSKEEIIFSYPGFFAIYVYRIAHELYKLNVPFIPRMMTEYAHSGSGIDINPGATIGRFFFIDHGTGVVIGETTEIGDNVKLYQGVTLGALSTRKGQLLANVKRHPTIADNVTVYSGSSILGGETNIGEGSIIGGNTFITQSIGENIRVSTKTPELIYNNYRMTPKDSTESDDSGNLFEWSDYVI